MKSHNESYGFYGTTKSAYNLTDKEADRLFSNTCKIISKKFNVSERVASAILDFKDGRYLAEELTCLTNTTNRVSVKMLTNTVDQASENLIKGFNKLIKDDMKYLEAYLQEHSA